MNHKLPVELCNKDWVELKVDDTVQLGDVYYGGVQAPSGVVSFIGQSVDEVRRLQGIPHARYFRLSCRVRAECAENENKWLRQVLQAWADSVTAKNVAYHSWCEHSEDPDPRPFARAYDNAAVAERSAQSQILAACEKLQDSIRDST